ncbi:putative mercuric transport protein [Brevundimonas diminuta]|jgi:mercuric ion transport protein|uniref:Mercuric transport protein MerT n=3 Tax=Brevundimonas TaxID=41275 RepID=A0A246KG01_BREDI|nr:MULTISPECIES: mercuric transporter MerT family protein [Brevundimonas]EKY23945.1 putative mercuric transport protein [Brevundimonas diminuta 470-4]EGF94570.1 mercuric transport protein [Brevundimonas diminuta ATCC 11568]MBD3572579.1 mercury transporter MerT [Brevundimonas diminuta]MBD3819190.1 mercury transporter MerT [Brevundimonas diminuta]MBI2249040.1 mercury transporter MerT [Brevundimonas diminuta]
MAASDGIENPNGNAAAPADKSSSRAWLAVAGLAAAIGASSCCVLPLVLFALGVSGAWIGNVTVLAPYQPYFIVAAVAFLGVGFFRVYRRPRTACAEGETCARPGSTRLVKIALWAASVLVAIAVAFPYVAPLLLGA